MTLPNELIASGRYLRHAGHFFPDFWKSEDETNDDQDASREVRPKTLRNVDENSAGFEEIGEDED